MPVIDTNSILWNPNSDYIGDAEAFPMEDHISIQDVGLSQPVPVGCIRGWDDDLLQAVPQCFAPLSFDYISAFNSAAFETEELYSRRMSTVLFSALFTDSAATVDVYLLTKDKQGLYTIAGTIQLAASSIKDENNWYLAVGKELKTYGADTVKFYVSAPSAGEVSFRMAVV